MYQIKPIFDKSKVEVDAPTCMYKMKPVHDELQSGAASLTNGLDGAVSQPNFTCPPVDILQQIGNVLKVLVPLHIHTHTHINAFIHVVLTHSHEKTIQWHKCIYIGALHTSECKLVMLTLSDNSAYLAVAQDCQTFLIESFSLPQATNAHDLSDIQSRQSDLVKQLEVLRLKLNEMQKKLGDSPAAIRAESTTPSTIKPAAIRPIDVCTATYI